MSSIDNRIVEMEFNNKRFEDNARQTMSTLDKLKEKLSFKSSTRELEEFQNAADSFNLGRIASTVEEIGDKFTMLGNLGQQAMQRIANAAIDAGVQLVKSISVDQISAGMEKYEQETNVIQTLYGALKPKGTKLEEIYDVMETLTAYSDETSYSYTQMADAVSKFVNAGVDLKKSETVIEGISNAAALAGIGIHDTEIIYRNFADAIGKGGFRSQDWKSIKIAHMDTEWLKEAFIEEAIAQGKLDKSGRVLTKAEKKNKKGEVTAAAEYKNVRDDFEGTLIKGWLDNDVINGVMLKYATRDLEGFGKEAFAAAQNAKTFTDVIDAVKDAASTGWSRTFRIIFGDLEEAIAFFTPMANKIIEVVNAIDEARNTMFEKWKDLGGRDSMIATLDGVWTALVKIGDQLANGLISTLYKTFYPTWKDLEESETNGGIWSLMGEQLAKFTKKLENAADSINKWLNGRNMEEGPTRFTQILDIFKGIFSVLRMIGAVVGGVFTFIGSIFDQLQPTIDEILTLFADLGWDLSELNKDLSKQKGFTAFAKNLAAMFEPLTKRLPKVIRWIGDLYKRFKKFWTTDKGFVAFRKSVENAFNAFIGFVPKALESIIAWGKGIVEMVKNSDEWKALMANYNKYVKPLLSVFRGAATQFNNALADFFSMDTSDEATMWGKIKKRFSAFDQLGPWLQQTWDGLKKQFPWLHNVEDWWDESPVVAAVKEWVRKIGDAIDAFMSVDTSDETSIVGKIKKRFEAMWAELGPWLTGKWEELKKNYPILQTISDTLANIFGGGDETNAIAEEGTESIGIFDQLLEKLRGFAERVSEWLQGKSAGDFLKLGLMFLGIIEAFKIIKRFNDWTTLASKIGDAVSEIGGIFEQARKTIKNNNMLQKATLLVEIASAIWLLADSLSKIAALSWEQIAAGLVGMGGIFAETGGFIAILSVIEKHGTPIVKLKSGMLVSIGLNMELMADSLKTLSEIADWGAVARGLAAMGGIFAEQAGFMILLGFAKNHGIESNAAKVKTLLGIAANMKTLGDTLKTLSELTWEEIGRGLAAMGGIFAEQAGFMIVIGAANKVGLIGGLKMRTLIGVAANMKSLGETLQGLSGLTLDQVSTGLTALGGIFAEQAGFMIVVGAAQRFTEPVKFTSLIGTALNMKILAGIVIQLGSMKTEEARQGIGALALIFGEEAAFMLLVGIAQSFGGPVSFWGMIGTAANMFVLAEEVQKLGLMTWDEIGRGLTAMAGLFAVTGAYTTLMNRLNDGIVPNNNAMQLANGVMAGGFGVLGESLQKLGLMNWDEIGRGLTAMAGLFAETGAFSAIMGHLKTMRFTQAISMTMFSAAIYLLAKSMIPLSELSEDQIKIGLESMGLIAGGLGTLVAAMGKFKPAEGSMKTFINTLAVGVAVAAMMYVFALSVKEVKDIDPAVILNFATAIDMAAAALAAVAGVVQALGNLGLATSIKGEIALAGIGGVIALITSLFGEVIAGLSNNMALVGANLAQFNDQVKDLDMTKIETAANAIGKISEALVEAGSKNYGVVDTFRTSMARMGSSIRSFSLNTDKFNPETVTAVTGALKQMATDLSGFPEVADVGTSIGHIGGAIKLYAESLDGTDLTKAPDSTALRTVFDTLNDAIPNDENLKLASEFASESKGKEMTDYAIGLGNIATAVSDFSKTAATLNFDNMQKAVDALTAISDLDTGLSTTAVVHFGPFGIELNQQKTGLSTFADDIILLGTALNAFGTDIGSVDIDKMKSGVDVLKQITKMNRSLPKTGGLSQWLTGTQSLTNFAANLRLLGGGAKEFGAAVSDATFNATSVSNAGDALIKIAEINGKLPETGGISSWFTGDESLSGFGSSLGALGEGVVKFSDALGDKEITKNIIDSVSFLNSLSNIQVKLGKTQNWYSLATFGNELSQLATSAVAANTTLAGMDLGWEDPTGLLALVDGLADVQLKLGNVTFRKSLADLGIDVKNMLDNIYSFTYDASVFGPSESGKLDRLSSAIVGIFGTINETMSHLDDEGTGLVLDGENIIGAIVKGMADDTSKDSLRTTTNSLCFHIGKTVGDYKNTFKIVGTWIPAGLGDGIWENRYAAINAAIDVMNEAIAAAETTAGIASPSKKFAQIGMYSDMGLAKGLMDSVYLVDSAAGQVSQSALDTVLNDMKAIQDLPLDQLEINPTIRPVLDTSGISSRAGMIDGILGGQRTIGFNTRQLEAQAQILGDTTGTDIGMISAQINELRDQLVQLETTMANIKMVVNTGALVGAMRSDLDKALGSMARMGERGN